MHTYCLFCETQKCDAIAHIIQKTYGIRSIYPIIVQRKWVKGKCLEERHDWLPGYVFLYSEGKINPDFRIGGVIRWLEYTELQGSDYDFAMTLYQQNGVMGTIRLAEVGDRCEVSDPNWEGIHGTVTKVDRSRKRCCVEFQFANIQRSVWVGYDLVKRSEGEGP